MIRVRLISWLSCISVSLSGVWPSGAVTGRKWGKGKALGPHVVRGRVKGNWRRLGEAVDVVIGVGVIFSLFGLCHSVHGVIVGVGE